MDVFAQQRTAERAHRLGLSQLACLGQHTITGLICTAGRQWLDWSADYRLFSESPWQAQRLFDPVIGGTLQHLPGAMPFVTALDDTHLRKAGKKTPGVGWKRDPMGPPFRYNLIRAQRFIQMSAMLADAEGPTRAMALPIRFDHAPSVPKPKRSAPPEAWKAYRRQCRQDNLSTRGRAAIQETRQILDQRHNAGDRQLVVAVDNSYTNQYVIKDLPDRTTLIGRVRKDTKFFYPATADEQPPNGRTRRYGRRAPTPEALRKDETVPWQPVQAFAAGKVHTFRVKMLGPLLWKKAGPDRPLCLVVIAPVSYRLRKGSKLLYRRPAYLICLDPDLPVEKIVQYYLRRWPIEGNHRDEKQAVGVGEAQVRAEQSVDRQPAFAVASYAMLRLAGLQAFGLDATEGTMPPPKWRAPDTKQGLSIQDLIQQLRQEVWAYALDQLNANSDSFATTPEPTQKPSKCNLPLAPAVVYATNGR
jgi:hypothetical protein